MKKIKIITIAGARPNFMKIAPILRLLDKDKSFSSILVHTGQHYDYKMSDVFFKDLDIRQPNYFMNVKSGSHALQTANIMIEFEKICVKENPDIVLVVGDVNSTMACSIVAKKLHIKIAHVEAGLRSFDKDMPEEINRLITDSISDLFFVTEKSGEINLVNEGHDIKNIFFVGNLMIDSLYYGLDKIKSNITKSEEEHYGLVTLHRPSNVDDFENLKSILAGLSEVAKNIRLFFSVHPRTKKNIENYKIDLGGKIEILEPLPYLSFLDLMRKSKVIFTDSGGIQEEATVLKIPCYTIRYNTERPITISQGTNRLVNPNKSKIIEAFNKNGFNINPKYAVPEGWDGKTAQRIIKVIKKEVSL